MAAMTLDELFRDDAILLYPEGLDPTCLTHTYMARRECSSGDSLSIDDAHALLLSLREDIGKWYLDLTGKKMDTYNLGEHHDSTVERFHTDGRFLTALCLLDLDRFSVENLSSVISLPWWIEQAGGELSHRVDAAGVHVALGTRHSYETQFIRAGYPIPIKSVSVGSLIRTCPEEGFPEGHLAIGVRGGASYSNTYHINAGALKITPGLKQGTESIADRFHADELRPEFGLDHADVRVSLYSRIFDNSIERGPMYIFLVDTPYTRAELLRCWSANSDEDKQEHDVVAFVPARQDAVCAFIERHYRGHVANRRDRTHDERYLLHPGALALAGFAGMAPSDLRVLYQEGRH